MQGRVLIVDDRGDAFFFVIKRFCLYIFLGAGFVCPRHEIRANGCCNDGISSVIQYSCETCESNNCCAIYEYCISCCLHPDKVSCFCFRINSA